MDNREQIKRELGFDLAEGGEYRLEDQRFTVTHTPAKPQQTEQTITILDYDFDWECFGI